VDQYQNVRELPLSDVVRSLGVTTQWKSRKGNTEWSGACPVCKPKKNRGNFSFPADGDPKIEDPRDIVIKITSRAICDPDLHLFDGYQPTMDEGDVLGSREHGRSRGRRCRRREILPRQTGTAPNSGLVRPGSRSRLAITGSRSDGDSIYRLEVADGFALTGASSSSSSAPASAAR
jgi:hypothetical protein